ncbi:nucleotidyltransferase family protein [Rhodovulum euryhalinum]|uniref:MurNAc alpha-1-phosphate uridylyltransferase n=1 Tax=Rhodovulum euryhalinum TaxID=35805 RepID=A0A4R2KJH0_9RHOB|nr:nucleotidyltransferase family protein [Rhodovulum euryhalinum]TCO73414.1 MurNAc alpha-1-phosphate uridylyltransferase [Rhodovulum euryhalinum]
MPDALMLFAAGFGTRMGRLTADRPKPLIRVGGRALIDHALVLAEAAGVTRTVVNTHYLAGQVQAHLAGRDGITISHEAGAILDTGGGLKRALPLLEADTVFTLNSDAVWTGPNPLTRLAAAWAPDRMDALLLLIDSGVARGHSGTGDFAIGTGGCLSRGGTAVYTGAQIVKTRLLDDIDEAAFSLNRAWDRAIAAGRLFGALHAGGWCDVGHPGGIAEAEAMLAEAAGDV